MSYDPFLSSGDLQPNEVLALVKSYQFSEELYHSDDYGHVQVQAAPQLNPYNISSLINEIEEQKLWPDCIELLSSQDEQWLMNFSTELQKSDSPNTLNCLVQLTDYISSPSSQIAHLQYAAQWPWHLGTVELIIKIQQCLTQLKHTLEKGNGLDAELDLAIVQQTQAALEPIDTMVHSKS